MASVNKVIIVGNIGKDPETRFMPNGNAVCNLTVATSEKWKDKETDEKKESTEWHRCVMYGKLAEIAEKYLKKGSSVYLEGKITTRKWQDKEGQDRYTTELVMHAMQMLGGKPEGSQSSGGGGGNDAGRAPEKKKTPSFEDMDDDIPFVSCSFLDDATARKAIK